jgi:flagellar motor switch/type III secretory pathway protein FliN
MAAFMPDIADDVVMACRGGVDEIVAALTRAFDGLLVGVTVNEPTTYDAESPPEGFDGAGLAVIFQCASTSAVAVLPESSGMLPTWYRQPDPTGKSKLSTLAQELSMLLLPASHIADEYHIVPLDQLAASLARAELADGAPLVPIALKHAEKQGQLSLLWPVTKHSELLPKSAPAAAAPAAAQRVPADAGPPPGDDDSWDDLSRLPRYTRSFLKVQVPVSVNLASQKHTVQEIRELVSGAIIKFDKSCDDLLELVVCDQPIAAGEVVKVGDKFGLRIRSMILPQEQFIAIKTTMSS